MIPFSSDESVARYIALAQREKALDRDEEIALFRRFKQDNDPRAAEAITRSHLHAVVLIAQQYGRYGLRPAELIAEGNFGLVHAMGKFDLSRGYRFMTYARYWIRAYVLDYVLRTWSLVRTGSGALRSKLFFKLRRERMRVVNALGEGDDADRVLAERMNLTVPEVTQMLGRLEARDLSLDVPLADGTPSLADRLAGPDDQEQKLAEVQTRAMLEGVIRTAIGKLDDRERFIVEHRLMADREEELSLAEMGRRLGVSRERARQLEERAKKKLRGQIRERYELTL
jgi:RNA polymerase sigma-32 factor